MQSSLPKKFERSAVAFFFASTLCFFGPAQIFFSNIDEFNYGFGGILTFLAGLTLTAFALTMLLLGIMPEAVSSKILSLLLAASVLLWLQGNYLVWNYGVLDGHDIPWGEKNVLGLIDTPIWILLLVLAFCRSQTLKRIARPLSLALIAVQTLTLFSLAVANADRAKHQNYGIDRSRQFAFSGDRNIVIVVLDTFQTDIFQELLNENKGYEEIFTGFTYFRNSLGGSPSTITSIPVILTARQYDNSLPLPDFFKTVYCENSLPLLLKKNGYRCDIFAMSSHGVYLDKSLASNLIDRNPISSKDVTFLMDLSLFRQMPHLLKKAVYNRQEWFLTRLFEKPTSSNINARQAKRRTSKVLPDRQFVNTMLAEAKIDSSQPVFKFYHLRGIHPPLRMNASCQYERLEFNRGNFKLQAKGLMTLMAEFLAELRRIGAFSNSLILIIGDHGPGNWGLCEINLQALGISLPERRENIALRKVKAGALPLILAKPLGDPGAKPLTISDAPVCLGDIPVTAAAAGGLENDFPGRPLFQIAEKEKRSRRYLYYEGFRRNSRGYMNTMSEYWVRGFSWLDQSWQASQRTFPAKK